MTTQHTPYDATITTGAKHLGLGANDVINRNIEQDYLLLCARAEGYLCCVADYAPFLEAARAAYGYICELEEIGHADHPFADIGSSKDCLLCEAMTILRAAIAAAERGNA